MNRLIIKFALTIVLFLFIYNPPVRFFPMNTGIIIGGIFFVFYFFELLLKIDLAKRIQLNRKLVQVIVLIGLLVSYSLLVPLVNGSRDLQVFKSYLSFFLFYLPGSFGIIHLLKKYYSGIDILKIIITVTVIQALIIVVMFINPAIKDLLFSLLRDAGERAERSLSSGGFRFLGFSFGTTWDLSIVQSLGIMSIFLLFKIDKSAINLKNTLVFILLLVSVVLSGRTGILGILLGLVIIIVPLKKNEIPFYKLVKFSALVLVILLPLYFFIVSLIPPNVLDMVQNNVVPWAFEMFQKDNGGTLETTSSNELKTMYFLPSFWTFLFGDGYYVNPQDTSMYYMNTDAGYMRHILFYGITGCLMAVALYLVVFYQMLTASIALHRSPAVKLYILLIAVFFFASHIKGDLLLGADMPIKMIFLLYAMFISFSASIRRTGDFYLKN